jgi:hypothetical protein
LTIALGHSRTVKRVCDCPCCRYREVIGIRTRTTPKHVSPSFLMIQCVLLFVIACDSEEADGNFTPSLSEVRGLMTALLSDAWNAVPGYGNDPEGRDREAPCSWLLLRLLPSTTRFLRKSSKVRQPLVLDRIIIESSRQNSGFICPIRTPTLTRPIPNNTIQLASIGNQTNRRSIR